MGKVIGESNVGAIVMFNPVIARPSHPSSKVFPKFGGDGVFSEAELKSYEDMNIVEVMEKYF